jgi:LmbE family N-acetylglucosaminyl deacetylase
MDTSLNSKEFTALTPKIVLGIAAHPDDLDFIAGGTMAKFAAAGAQVYYLILTDGSKGTSDPNLSSEELVTIRQKEQRSAVAAVGGADVEFLGYPDGMLEITMDLKRDIVKAIRTVKPDVVITMDPSMLYSAAAGTINHPDHRAAGQAALDAVFPLARDHLSFPELFAAGLQPHITPTVLLANFDDRNFFMDISEHMDAKMAALAAHASQFDDMDLVQERLKQMAAFTGAKTGSQYAESFIRIDIN